MRWSSRSGKGNAIRIVEYAVIDVDIFTLDEDADVSICYDCMFVIELGQVLRDSSAYLEATRAA